MTINEVIIAGRLTKDPELRHTQNDTAVASAAVALDRYMGSNKDNSTDFIPIVAWGNTAIFLEKYFFKGKKVIVKGNLHSRTWEDDDGRKHFVLEVWAEKVDFADDKKPGETAAGPNQYQGSYQQSPQQQQSSKQPQQQSMKTPPPWMQIDNDEELPF